VTVPSARGFTALGDYGTNGSQSHARRGRVLDVTIWLAETRAATWLPTRASVLPRHPNSEGRPRFGNKLGTFYPSGSSAPYEPERTR
jgi:hypothetical protein